MAIDVDGNEYKPLVQILNEAEEEKKGRGKKHNEEPVQVSTEKPSSTSLFTTNLKPIKIKYEGA